MENNPNEEPNLQPKKRAYNRKPKNTENEDSNIQPTTEQPKKRVYNRKSPLTPKGGTNKEESKGGTNKEESPLTPKEGTNKEESPLTPKGGTNKEESPLTPKGGTNAEEETKENISDNNSPFGGQGGLGKKPKNFPKELTQNDLPKLPKKEEPQEQPQNQEIQEDIKPKKDWEKELTKYFAQNPERKIHISKIFKDIRANNAQKGFIIDALEKLLIDEKVTMTKDSHFQSTTQKPEMLVAEGKVEFVNASYAFVVCPDRAEDIWVSAYDLKNALDGDVVKVGFYPSKKNGRQEGKVIDIMIRKRDEFVGKLEFYHRNAFIAPEMRRMYKDIRVEDTKGAKRGEKVVVKITDWGSMHRPLTANVIEVLGKAGTNNAEMHAILAEYNLPRQFPQEVLDETQKIQSKVTPDEIKKRRDFRHITTLTIDPADAKDFDDAISLLPLDNGNWEIGIHIADASHYIQPNTELDKEAVYRATSVYLVDRVVPMLPEKLSNDLCSLKPNEDRLTFSAVFELDEEGNVHGEWFGKSVIHSNRRFSYEEAQERLDTKKGDYAQELKVLNYIAKFLTKKRFAKGAINFETIEVKFKLDENSRPIGIYFKERKDAHRLIEEYMLLANQRVAEFVVSQLENDHPKTMVYRTHESPNMEKLENFSKFAKTFGYDISLNGKQMARSINKLIDDTTNTPQQNILQSLAVRTMAKAKYSTEMIGHFGLAMPHYTHFTSPIRRYPDILAHRLLEKYLKGLPSENQKTLDKICQHATDMEKRATEAERASTKYKQVEYMQMQDRNKIYDGVVTGVTEWGVYVEMTETKCEGMVRLTELWNDEYELDAPNYCVIGKHTGKKIAFGDLVKVKLKDTNIEKRTIDLSMIIEENRNQNNIKRQKQRQKEKTRKRVK
jgi:ribonuclease R